MKVRLLFAIIFLWSLQSGFSQTNVTLNLNPLLGSYPFALNQVLSDTAGNYFAFTRLEYYISEIKLIHDGGQETPVTELFLLVNPSIKSDYDLGSFQITHLESIQFSLGVDSAHNHLDPATFPPGHPLAPQDPSMQWGWTSGYRFLAVEGISGFSESSLPDIFQFHTIGDQNYRTVTLPLNIDAVNDQILIPVDADYLRLLDNIRFWGGVISHSTTGRAAEMHANLADYVYTVSIPTGISEPNAIGSILAQPNPVTDAATITYSFPGWNDLTVSIVDINGRAIMARPLQESEGQILLPMPYQSGVYLAVIQSKGRIIASTKLLVQ